MKGINLQPAITKGCIGSLSHGRCFKCVLASSILLSETLYAAKVDVVFIPALLCDEQLYRKVIDVSSTQISPAVMMSSKPTLADRCADILARAP